MNLKKNLIALTFSLFLFSTSFGQYLDRKFFNQDIIDYVSPYYADIQCPDGQFDIVVKSNSILLHPLMTAMLQENRPFFVHVYLNFVEREYCYPSPNEQMCGDYNMGNMTYKSVGGNVLLVAPDPDAPINFYGNLQGGLVGSRTLRISHDKLKNSVRAFHASAAYGGSITIYNYDLKARVVIDVQKSDGTYFTFEEETIIPVIYC